MPFSRYFMGAVAVASMAALAPAADAQQADTTVTFRIFLRGSPIGSEDVSVQRSAQGWTISGTGHLGAPLDLTTRRLEVRYDANWKPQELTIDANTKGATFAIHTTFANGQAESEINQTGVVKRKTDAVSADTVVLPNLFFGTYEALALRLASIPVGSTFHAYVAPQAEIVVKQTARSSQRIETAKRVVDVKTYALTFQNPGAPLDATLWTDETGRLVRFEVPAQSLLVARDDFASVSARALVMSRAGDQPVTIAANGFNLAGTLSQPSGPATKGRYPAILMIGGSGPTDRDETVAGIPIFAQIAGDLADGGYYVLRYDKRGVGKSGGRAEGVSIDDYIEDATAALRFLRERKDVDDKHLVVFGHSEGAWVALAVAARDGDVAALVMAAGPSGNWRRTRARAAAIPARKDHAQRRGEAGPHRSPEAHPGSRRRQGPLGRRAGAVETSGGHAVVPELPRILARAARGEDEAADPHPAGRSRSSGRRGTRRQAGGDGKGAQEGRSGPGVALRRRQPPARAGEDRRRGRVSELDGRVGRPASREDDRRVVEDGAQAELKFGPTAVPLSDDVRRARLQSRLYSYRSASIGSRRDARIAGSSPLTRPTRTRIPEHTSSSSADSTR